jgi:hypothetical protein
MNNLQHSFKPSAVEIHQRLDDLLGQAADGRVRHVFHFTDQAFDGLDPALNLFFLGHPDAFLARKISEKPNRESPLSPTFRADALRS